MQKFTDEKRIQYQLKGLIISIYDDDFNIYTSGHSMTTVPVTPDMHYRIGGQGIPALTTLFLILVDQGYLKLKTKIGDFLPKTPNGNQITLQMLCNMTSGLEDVIKSPLVANADVFKEWKTSALLSIIYTQKPLYRPGERFYFGHITNMLLLCVAMQIRMNISLEKLLNKYIFNPLSLPNLYEKTQLIRNPTLHSFSKYRVDIEDVTYWNASWASYAGRMNANATETNHLANGLATGKLLSHQSYHDLLGPEKEDHYGMGLAVTHINNTKVIWSNANIQGYIGMWAYVNQKIITIQTNTDNVNGFEINNILKDLLNYT